VRETTALSETLELLALIGKDAQVPA